MHSCYMIMGLGYVIIFLKKAASLPFTEAMAQSSTETFVPHDLAEQMEYNKRMERKRTREYERQDRNRREQEDKRQQEVRSKWPQICRT